MNDKKLCLRREWVLCGTWSWGLECSLSRRECSLIEAWVRWLKREFVGWSVRVHSWIRENSWAELMRERKWRVVSKREVDSYDVAWCRTWRGVRLNVAERVVERGGACGWTWRSVRLNVVCWTEEREAASEVLDLLSRTQRDVLSLFLELQDDGGSVDVSWSVRKL